MNHFAKRIIHNPLISGSAVIFLGTFFANIFNYGFSLILGRILPVADYGLIVSLASIIAIFSLFQVSFSNIFSKFSAQYSAKNNTDKIKILTNSGIKIMFVCGFIVLLAFLAGIPFLTNFLKIDNTWLLIFVAFYIFISFLYSLPYGILQGKLKFFQLSLLNITSSGIKIIGGVFLVTFGLGVIGALSGYMLAIIVPFVIASILVFFKTGFSWKASSDTTLFFKEFRKYSFYFFLASLGITIFNTLDVVLVRNIFDGATAGQYAALSVIGKSIFYLTSPIYFVFFPLISKKNELKENLTSTLLMSGFIIFSVSTFISLFYFIFPHLVVNIFFPAKEYVKLSNYVGLYSLFIIFFSLAFLLHNFFLSIERTAIYKINLTCGFLVILLISIFHRSLYDVIWILLTMSIVLFISLLIYYFYSYARN